MDQKEKIQITEKNFTSRAKNLWSVVQYDKDFFNALFNIKLGVVSFIGVIVSIVFSNADYFSRRFLLYLILLMLCAFVLLVVEIWLKYFEINSALKEQYKETYLAKILDIAVKEEKFVQYGRSAEEKLESRDSVRQKMNQNMPIDKVIDCKTDKFRFILLILWSFTIVITPLMFVLFFLWSYLKFYLTYAP